MSVRSISRDIMTTDYNKIAEDYPHDAFYIKYVDEYTFFKLIGNIRGLSIMEIGCGRGEYARQLKKKALLV